MKSKNNKFKSLFLGLLFVLVILLAAGCSSGSDKSAETDQGTQTQTETQTQNDSTAAPDQTQQDSQDASSSTGLPKMPHKVEGHEDCLKCHQDGSNGAPATPHPDRKDQCTTCHNA